MRKSMRVALGIVVVTLLLPACSSGSKADQAATGTTTTGAVSAGPINVALKEFSVTPSRDQTAAGRVTFVAKNDGPLSTSW